MRTLFIQSLHARQSTCGRKKNGKGATTSESSYLSILRTHSRRSPYQRCGVFVLNTAKNPLYATAAHENDVSSGAHVTEVRSSDDLKKFFPDVVTTGFDSPSEVEMKGYINHDGGWAESARALDIILERVRAGGGEVLAGKEVSGVMRKGAASASDSQASPCVTGVRCTDGSGYHVSTVIVAAGAWTPRLMQRLGIDFTSSLLAPDHKGEVGEAPQVQELQQEAMGQHVGVGVATGYAYALFCR